jgi:UDP-N-acetylmuramate: L-alanyl-gamma-D-glutamyl-meso-diaminopimelate ligase
MHIHILGIAGTFMASLALLAKQLGFKVTGQDQNIYPPMSTQLESSQIDFINGYQVADLPEQADLIVIGNVMTRGMPIIEHILANNLAFISGPEFLSKYILANKQVLVVSGTHGKTTTTSMLAWILDYANLDPGYLIGGVAKNFATSARLGGGKLFVIEGDEYDCAFFDKRSKFIHYQPKTLIINNIEFDHADIFTDLSQIILQFHYLVRLIPSTGSIIYNSQDNNIKQVLAKGCWSKLQDLSFDNNVELITQLKKQVKLTGEYNYNNATAAILAAMSVGVNLDTAIQAMQNFAGVKRRLEHKGCYNGINIYDDFAHHPTAIKATIDALVEKIDNNSKLISIIDLGSNTLKLGSNNQALVQSMAKTDQVYLYADLNKITWDLQDLFKRINKPGKVCGNTKELINNLTTNLKAGDNLLFMSNGSLAKTCDKLVEEITSIVL